LTALTSIFIRIIPSKTNRDYTEVEIFELIAISENCLLFNVPRIAHIYLSHDVIIENREYECYPYWLHIR